MKVIATVNKPEDAHLIRATLEGSGIAAFVRDDTLVSVDWVLANAIGGIKVEVADEDLVQAEAVLASFEAPAQAKPPAGKSKSFGRYFVIFGVAAILAYGVFALRGGLASPFATRIAISASVAAGFLVAFLSAMMEL